MTEADWLACTDFNLLWDRLAVTATARKRRLFECACCRRFGDPPLDESSRLAVEVAERYADGMAGPDELAIAHATVIAGVDFTPPWTPAVQARASAAATARSDDDADDAWSESIGNRVENAQVIPQVWSRLDVLREVVGNPFRSAALAPAWLAWQDGTVGRLARVANDDRRLPDGTLDPARLAVLADALEDAGCTDAELLGHLRGPGPHVRGCWALDRLLARQ